MKVYDTLVLILAFIPLILQIFKPTTQESITIMGIMTLIGLMFVIWSYANGKFDKIDKNREEINNLRAKIKLMEYFHDIDKRLTLLEE
ncbi:MAG: hypothetical protein V1718_00785, partial [archaeon]